MISSTTATTSQQTSTVTENPNGILDKDDFMMLLLAELQYQDPTEPTDTETILTQTSQLAALEASDNTNKALEDLAISLGNSQQFSAISAIGKTADLGSNAISYSEGEETAFEVYFPQDIASGNIEILNSSGETIQTIDILSSLDLDEASSGVYQFEWNGKDSAGNTVDDGIYYVTSSYTNSEGEAQTTRLGAYPIESMRFDGGQTYVKVGSSYIDLASITEIY